MAGLCLAVSPLPSAPGVARPSSRSPRPSPAGSPAWAAQARPPLPGSSRLRRAGGEGRPQWVGAAHAPSAGQACRGDGQGGPGPSRLRGPRCPLGGASWSVEPPRGAGGRAGPGACRAIADGEVRATLPYARRPSGANTLALCFLPPARADIALIGLAVMGQNLILNMNDHGFVVSGGGDTLPSRGEHWPVSRRPRGGWRVLPTQSALLWCPRVCKSPALVVLPL